MASTGVKVEGLKESKSYFKNLTPRLKERIQKQNFKTATRVASRASKKAPVDTGLLARSISAKILGGSTLDAITYTNIDYAPHVEYGTRPHFPPPLELRGWARRHGMPGMEFAIAREIARRGTTAKPFFRPAWQEEKNTHIAEIKKILRGLDNWLPA